MRRISGLLPKRALAPRPRCGAAAPRASPFLLLPPGPGSVGAGRARSVRFDQLRPWPLPPSVAALPPPHPDQSPAVAARPGRPCPALRRLRPASPPRSAAVCGASCALLSVTGTPRRWARPEHRRHAQCVPAAKPDGPVEDTPSSQQLAPGKAWHGCDCPPQGSASHAPTPREACHGCKTVGLRKREALRASRPFFSRLHTWVKAGKKTSFFLLKGGGRSGRPEPHSTLSARRAVRDSSDRRGRGGPRLQRRRYAAFRLPVSPALRGWGWLGNGPHEV